MSEPTSQSQKWGPYVICFLLTSLTSEGATLLSGLPVISASTIHAASQRTASSTTHLGSAIRELANVNLDGCSSTLLEKFFRVVSATADETPPAQKSAILELLSGNDRANFLSSTGDDWRMAKSRDFSRRSDHHSASKRPDRLRNLNEESFKRQLPKFNPTGWRRKRATYTNPCDFQRLFGAVRNKLLKATPRQVSFPPELAERRDDVSPKFAEWGKKGEKRESLRRVLQRLPKELKPKRRPLEFNPTGW